ncbi:hypothetical protein [Limosilactobacillus mucosae]|uniref:hypothetical protein n=1 Tax=Limosilactobacillus mucosae TaxID=97478 RepID=UPI001F5931D4|nr:hypothetical protein [Limosilactobacillus mucosae]UNL62221.1 hypothetical protein G8B17_08240 [Limosilactobacillus mucosae]
MPKEEMIYLACALKKCLSQTNYHWQHGDSVNGHYGIFLESEEGDKYSEFIYYLEAHSASRVVIDFNEQNMRFLMEYIEMVLGKIDFDGEFAQQLYSSGNLY